MNILISSAGRQLFLVNAFKEAVNKNGYIFAADNNRSAPALNVADDFFILPPYNSKEYFPRLLDICKTNKIGLLITLNVDELLLLEPQREALKENGCSLLGGDLEMIKMTYDKLALADFSKKIGIYTPKIYSNEELHSKGKIKFPLLVKPRFGKGSRGQIIIDSFQRLQEFVASIESKNEGKETYIFQEFIKGQEYGLDIVNDFSSKYTATLVRKKHAMKNGETFEATTQSIEGWIEVARVLSENLKHQGTIDVDFMVQNNKQFLIDINHRFGGGYIFSHIAGANLPKTIINWLLNIDVDNNWLQPIIGVHSQRDGLSIKIIQ